LWEQWQEVVERDYWAMEVMDGAIPIGHQGCSFRTWLVVSGPLSGTIWEDHRCDYKGIWPVLDQHNQPLSFLNWYRHWLNQSIAALS